MNQVEPKLALTDLFVSAQRNRSKSVTAVRD